MKEKENENLKSSQAETPNVDKAGEPLKIEDTEDKEGQNNNKFLPAFKSKLKELFDEFQNEEIVEGGLSSKEKELEPTKGRTIVIVLILLLLFAIILLIIFCVLSLFYLLEIPILIIVVEAILLCCFKVIQPGEALVISYYGTYMGTCKKSGFYWIRPCSNIERISLKSNHYNGSLIKVNDKDGTPICIGIICVWRIKDSVKVIYGVNDYRGFIKTQTESAVRYIGNKFPYDSRQEGEITLKSGNEEINKLLKLELQRRTRIAGVEIEDARITEISYSNEIAEVMLKKQAAESVVYSKEKIAKGSIDIIENSIKEMENRNVCSFSNDAKSKIASNLLMILNMHQNTNSYVKLNVSP